MVLIIEISKIGNILATENQQAILNDVIDVKMSVYSFKNINGLLASITTILFHVLERG